MLQSALRYASDFFPETRGPLYYDAACCTALRRFTALCVEKFAVRCVSLGRLTARGNAQAVCCWASRVRCVISLRVAVAWRRIAMLFN